MTLDILQQTQVRIIVKEFSIYSHRLHLDIV